MRPIFITGTGTDVGKTIVSVIVANALHADYWKPVQAGYENGTDAQKVQHLLAQPEARIHPETYRLKLPASPHIAAKQEGIRIEPDIIAALLPKTGNCLVIEGAGGLFVPLNEKDFIIDLIKKLDARVIIVSRNYLGSINHSLLTAAVCRQQNIRVEGWIFTDRYMNYQEEIALWSGYPVIGTIPWLPEITREALQQQAELIKEKLKTIVEAGNL